MQWIFWVGPFTGAALAAFYHKIVLRDIAVIKEALFSSFRSTGLKIQESRPAYIDDPSI